MNTKTISASSTILWGIITTTILILLFFIATMFTPLPTWANVAISVGFPLIVLISGFVTIQPTQTGLLNVFGTRQRTAITEGIAWLPPFTSVAIYDSKEQSTNIPEMELLTANQISMKTKISYNWRVVDIYQVSNLDINVIGNGLTELVKNEVRSEMLSNRFNDINFINSDKSFIRGIVNACNETAKQKWGIEITELFISTIKPTTDGRRDYYEAKTSIDEIAEDAARIAKILNITPREAFDKYARERNKNFTSVEHIYSGSEISQIISLIEKILKK